MEIKISPLNVLCNGLSHAVTWQAATSHAGSCIVECHFENWLHYFQLSSLLMCLKGQRKIPQVLETLPPMWMDDLSLAQP